MDTLGTTSPSGTVNLIYSSPLEASNAPSPMDEIVLPISTYSKASFSAKVPFPIFVTPLPMYTYFSLSASLNTLSPIDVIPLPSAIFKATILSIIPLVPSKQPSAMLVTGVVPTVAGISYGSVTTQFPLLSNSALPISSLSASGMN